MQSESLSAKKRRFIAAALTESSVAGAAGAAGVSSATGFRYLADPAVASELASRQDAILRQVSAGLVLDMAKARQTLRELMDSEDASDNVRLRAASVVLSEALRLTELAALAQRLDAIERRIRDEHEAEN